MLLLMRNFLYLPLAAAMAVVSLAVWASSAHAMPNYARETGVSCFTCHSKPAKKLGALDPLLNEDNGSFVYSAPVGEINAGLSIHKNPADISISKEAASEAELYSTLSPGARGSNNSEEESLTGLSGFLNNESFSASLSLLKPRNSLNDYGDGEDSELAIRYKLAFTPKVGGFDFALGLFGASKTPGMAALRGENTSSLVEPQAYGLDAKVQRQIGSVTLDLKAVYMNAAEGQTLKGMTRELNDVTDSFGAAANVGFNKRFGLSAAYRTYKGGSGEENRTEEVASIGAWVNFSKNTTLESQYTTFGEDRKFLTEDGVFTLLFITGF